MEQLEQIENEAYLKVANQFCKTGDCMPPFAEMTAFIATGNRHAAGLQASIQGMEDAKTQETDPAKLAALVGGQRARLDRLAFIAAQVSDVLASLTFHRDLLSARKADLAELRDSLATAS